jgi:hypothetical protein
LKLSIWWSLAVAVVAATTALGRLVVEVLAVF